MTVTSGRTQFEPRPPIKWTKRQQQVLDLLVKGYTNRQIGEALGISLDGAKWHVSEIIGILGVERREEAAEYWREYNGLPAKLRRVGSALTGGLILRWVAGVAGIVALALAAGLVWTALGNEGEDEAAATPAATAQAEGSAEGGSEITPGESDLADEPGVPVRDITLGDDVPLPPDVALLIGEGGWAHGAGGLFQLRRVYGTGAGEVRSETLFATENLGPGTHVVTGVVADESGRLMLSLCSGAECAMEGHHRDVVTLFLQSDDGGLSWREIDRRPGDWFVWASAGSEWYAIRVLADEAPVIALPSGREVVRPPGAGLHSLPVHVGGELGWYDVERETVLRGDGTPLPWNGAGLSLYGFVSGPAGHVFFATLNGAGGPLAVYLDTWRNGTGEILRLPVFAYPGYRGYPGPRFAGDVLWLDASVDSKPGCETLGIAPAVLNLRDGTLSFVAEFFEPECRGGTQTVLAVQQGPFARVVNTGDCLNVREQPGTSAPVVACYRDGVLLGDRGEAHEADGITWLAVTTPDGRPGWASAEFLER